MECESITYNRKIQIYPTKEQKDLLEQFKKLEDKKTNPIMKEFFEKAKRFWKIK